MSYNTTFHSFLLRLLVYFPCKNPHSHNHYAIVLALDTPESVLTLSPPNSLLERATLTEKIGQQPFRGTLPKTKNHLPVSSKAAPGGTARIPRSIRKIRKKIPNVASSLHTLFESRNCWALTQWDKSGAAEAPRSLFPSIWEVPVPRRYCKCFSLGLTPSHSHH